MNEVKRYNKNKDKVDIYIRGNHVSQGDSMQFLNKNVVYGWLNWLPIKGEYLIDNVNVKVFSIYRFDAVKKCSNPPDMFFADMVKVGNCDKHGEIIK